MRQWRRGGHSLDDVRNPAGDDLSKQIPSRGRRVRSGDNGADDGNAIEALCGGSTRFGQHGGGIGAVDAADADGWDGVAGGGKAEQDGADAEGADDGFCVFFAVFCVSLVCYIHLYVCMVDIMCWEKKGGEKEGEKSRQTAYVEVA